MTKACEPLLGIATLKAFLQANGVPCECIDANVEAQDWILSRDRIDALVARAGGPAAHRRFRSWPTLRRQLPRLKEQLRSWHAYEDEARYRTTVTSLNRVMAIAGTATDPRIDATLSNYEDKRYCDMDSRSVHEAAQHPEHNLFYGWFSTVLLPRLTQMNPSVVGLSFIFRSQLLPGVALAAMLREALPNTHVTLGGELVSAWVDRIEDTALMELADSIIPYEGELPLLALARADGTPDQSVPNIIWRDTLGEVRKNPTRKLATLAEIPAPDYSWAPWDLYFTPVRTAPMVTARGCYWNRCTFCPEVVNPETLLRLARVPRIAADMDELHDRWGVEHFHFIDSALPPRTMLGIAQHVVDNRRPYTWYGFSRLERVLRKPAVATLLAQGGCSMLKLGLETASQRLLDDMDKRQDVDDVSAILRALRAAGVLVHAFLMFGTPREHRADAEETRRFVAAHSDAIQFLNCSLMNLAHGSPMAEDPPAHGIHEVRPFEIKGKTLDLALYSNFVGEGWGRVAARRFLQKEFLRDPQVRPLHLRTPAFFDSNHSAFFSRALGMGAAKADLRRKLRRHEEVVYADRRVVP
jgi:radical SAM superfamily enzyme YgiQ (UPF0313 family)